MIYFYSVFADVPLKSLLPVLPTDFLNLHSYDDMISRNTSVVHASYVRDRDDAGLDIKLCKKIRQN